MQRPTRVGVIGLGVRGLTVLERLVAATRERPQTGSLEVVVFDSGRQANYSPSLPDYLLLNIMCGQVSSFPDESSVSHFKPLVGPSLFEWATERGLGFLSDGIHVVQGGSFEIKPENYLPRRLMGEYIEDSYGRIAQEVPPHVSIQRIQSAVSQVHSRGNRFRLVHEGAMSDVDFLFVTVGAYSELTPGGSHLDEHGVDVPGAARTITPVLPLPDTTADIDATETVAVAGMGLTAIDIAASLTIGRGGHFVRDGYSSEYIASGHEPHLILYSRTGLPYRSRPRFPRREPYTPTLFTTSRVAELLADRHGRLDFTTDVLPWLFAEMTLAYAVHSGKTFSDRELTRFALDPDPATTAGRIRTMAGIRFDAEDAYYGDVTRTGTALQSSADYERSIVTFIQEDMEQAWLGTPESALKFALELCRDLRDVIRLGVDHYVLTDSSTTDFFSKHRTLIDRIVVGPQLERNADLVALVRAGIVEIPLGPSPAVSFDPETSKWLLESTALSEPSARQADWLMPSFQQVGQDDPAVGLVRQMTDIGLVTVADRSPVSNTLDLDASDHPRAANGQGRPNVWILGLASEGTTYYNNYVMSPGKYVKGFAQADNAVQDLINQICL